MMLAPMAPLRPRNKIFVVAEEDDVAFTCPTRRSQSTCSLFVANSTIPGGGVGIFTSEALTPGDTVGFGDIMNPLIDLYWHRPTEFMNHDHPFFDYIWQGVGPVTLESVDKNRGSVLLMGFGLEAAINCHLALINTHSVTIVHDDYHSSDLHRSRDPGAGASTPYLSGTTRVAHPIPSGGELFKSYGDDWFVLRTKEFGLVPLSNDYVVADVLIQKFGLLFPEVHDPFTPQEMHKDLWDLMADFPYESRVTNAIPKNHDHIPAAITDGIWEPYIKDARRTIEELQQTGRCLDNISHGPSTLKQAGRGAFSTAILKAGSVITGSPLLHVKSDELFRMYEDVYNGLLTGGILDRLSDEEIIRTYQTALNYCWKHPESTMLLCPYGAGVNFINHNQSLANVKVQWAPHGHIGHDSKFLELAFSDIFQTRKAHLAFDFVALRNIDEGEELFLDYSSEWETAWQEHVRTFHDDKRRLSMSSLSEGYRSAHDLNREFQNSDIRTDKEQRLEPYPSNVELRCHSDAASMWTYVAPPELRAYTWRAKDVGLPCQVLAKIKTASGLTLYDIAVEDTRVPVASNPPIEICIGVTGIPISGLKFFDCPYTTDLHPPGTFRQPIGIPDELFPAAWKNLPTDSV